MYFIGVDPGKTGAIAVIGEEIVIHDCPTLKVGSKRDHDPASMADLLRPFSGINAFVAVERVASRPGQGVVSVFTFGTNYGIWQGILGALAIPHTLVTPQAWHKVMIEGQAKDKDASLQIASRLFPQLRSRIGSNHNRADALLIAEWARRSYLSRAA